MTEEIGSNIAIAFANIRRMAIGVDFGNPCKCSTRGHLIRIDTCYFFQSSFSSC